MFKRILLFFAMNALVILMITLILNVLHLRPYLSSYGMDLSSLALFCLIWGMVGALISLGLSRIMAKWMMGVQRIDPNTQDPELREVLAMVHRLAKQAHLPALPEVGVYRSNEVNAFATGPSRARSLVAVSTGLLQRMKSADIEAVLAHEVSHIANGDMVTMTLLQGVVNAFVMFLARILAYAFSGLGRSNRQENGSYMSYILFVYLFEIVFMILGSLLIAAYSRFREYRADAGGAQLAGKESMISALQTLRVFQEVHDKQPENPAMAAFKISHSGKRGWLALFSTHPPLEARIERLQISGQISG
ncbi:MAG: protease HtpX [Chlamydiia bacterium]|nr:protease HtpX [Chlamydiia bacterium]